MGRIKLREHDDARPGEIECEDEGSWEELRYSGHSQASRGHGQQPGSKGFQRFAAEHVGLNQ